MPISCILVGYTCSHVPGTLLSAREQERNLHVFSPFLPITSLLSSLLPRRTDWHSLLDFDLGDRFRGLLSVSIDDHCGQKGGLIPLAGMAAVIFVLGSKGLELARILLEDSVSFFSKTKN